MLNNCYGDKIKRIRWVGYTAYMWLKHTKLTKVIRVKECAVTSTVSRYGSVEDFCKHDNGTSESIKSFLDQPSGYQLPKNDCFIELNITLYIICGHYHNLLSYHILDSHIFLSFQSCLMDLKESLSWRSMQNFIGLFQSLCLNSTLMR